MEYWFSVFFICFIRLFVLMLEYLLNCFWVMGGRIVFKGLVDDIKCGLDIKELVMFCIFCRGDMYFDCCLNGIWFFMLFLCSFIFWRNGMKVFFGWFEDFVGDLRELLDVGVVGVELLLFLFRLMGLLVLLVDFLGFILMFICLGELWDRLIFFGFVFFFWVFWVNFVSFCWYMVIVVMFLVFFVVWVSFISFCL